MYDCIEVWCEQIQLSIALALNEDICIYLRSRLWVGVLFKVATATHVLSTTPHTHTHAAL